MTDQFSIRLCFQDEVGYVESLPNWYWRVEIETCNPIFQESEFYHWCHAQNINVGIWSVRRDGWYLIYANIWDENLAVAAKMKFG